MRDLALRHRFQGAVVMGPGGQVVSDVRQPPESPRTNASHLALLARDAAMPNFKPGSTFSYDHLAQDVAAMVIERSAAAPYAEVMAQRFSQPLQLTTFVRPARFAAWPRPCR